LARRRKKRKEKLKQHLKYEFYGILLLSIFILELAAKGEVGSLLNSFLRLLVGTWDFSLSFVGIYIAIYMMVKRKPPSNWSLRKTGLLFIFLSIITYNHLKFVELLQSNGQFTDVNIYKATWQVLANERIAGINGEVGGGMLGALFYQVFDFLFDNTGTYIMLLSFTLIGVLLVFKFSYVDFLKKIKKRTDNVFNIIETKFKDYLLLLNNKREARKLTINGEERELTSEDGLTFTMDEPLEPIIHDFKEKTSLLDQNEDRLTLKDDKSTDDTSDEDTQEIQLNGVSIEKLMEEEKNYLLPPSYLLDAPNITDTSNEVKDITNNAKKLEATLESFGVKAKVTQIHRGPAVTRYEIQPDIGVKVSRIVNLSDDIALALAAKDIRIEAPIPGKAAIGIEVPNTEVAMVTLREVIESSQFLESGSKLSIALGRDISGEPIIGNLAKMPHLLVAGATGSGKSVCINGMITSFLYKAKPSEVKLLMIDPKMVELNVYNGIPHLLAPVVTDPKKASKALKMIVNEMEKRYEKFAKKGARDIERYNQLILNETEEAAKNQSLLPYIVVIIDELADLMMVAPNDVEDAIIRLAQKARAAGIHLIVATQRPSVDVITGLIKANVPSRIAFGVSSQTDSRTILDGGGAEKLLGRGDMLYLPVGSSKPTRIQGAFISELEVEEVVRFVKEQQEVIYQDEIIPELDSATEQEAIEDNVDDLFYQAVELVVENKQASVSLLQRRLRIGYTRAARLIDEMEARQIVGPYEGSKPRVVLITHEQLLDQTKIPS